MIDFFVGIGFGMLDLILLVLCPLLGAVGSIVHVLIIDIDYTKSPKLKDYADRPKVDEDLAKDIQDFRGYWLVSRVIIGGVTGLVLALYFSGSIVPEATSVGRLLALAVIAGYVAPSFWRHQQYSSISTIFEQHKR